MSTNQFRNGEVYVSQKVYRGLHLAALKGNEDEVKVTADKLADEALEAWLRSNHADIMAWVDKRDQEQAAFKKSLSKPLPL